MNPALPNAITHFSGCLVDASQRAMLMESAKIEFVLDHVSEKTGSGFSHAINNSLARCAAYLHAQFLTAPEVQAMFDLQDPEKPLSLKIRPDGSVWTEVENGIQAEVPLSDETREFLKQLPLKEASSASY